MTFLSDRVNKIPPSGIRRFFDLVMSSKGIISLGVGEPDFLTPGRFVMKPFIAWIKGIPHIPQIKDC